ncbi:MAG: hypothetical protein ACXWET_06775 [Halobacteriota archaeon]
MQYEEVTRRDWERTALYLAGGMLLIMTAAIFLFAINRIIGAIIWFALIGVVLTILVSWHTKMYAYKCKQCGEQFHIPSNEFRQPSRLRQKRRVEVPQVPTMQQTRAR